MKQIICIGIIILCFSCKSTTSAQEKEAEKPSITNPKPKFTQKDQVQISPNTIRFLGKIIKIEKEVTAICGTNHENVATIEIMDNLASGSGIINLCNKGDQLKMVFIQGFSASSNKNDNHTNEIKEGHIFLAEAIEKLCPDTDKTLYYVSTYSIP